MAKPSSDQATLLANINYACSQVDCRIMQRGCPCFFPDILINRASVAMNLYYQSRGRNHWNCDFRGSGLVVITDPSKYSSISFIIFGSTIQFKRKKQFNSLSLLITYKSKGIKLTKVDPVDR